MANSIIKDLLSRVTKILSLAVFIKCLLCVGSIIIVTHYLPIVCQNESGVLIIRKAGVYRVGVSL